MSIHLLRRAREADTESGLSPERLSLLSILAYAGPQSIGRLAQIEQVSAPAISRTITSLEKLGLVRRSRGGHDARAVNVSATPKGRTVMELGRRRRLEMISEELARLTKQDVVTLSRVAAILEKLES